MDQTLKDAVIVFFLVLAVSAGISIVWADGERLFGHGAPFWKIYTLIFGVPVALIVSVLYAVVVSVVNERNKS